MTPKLIKSSAAALLIIGVLILTTDSYLKATDALNAKIAYSEQTYAKGQFEYYKQKDPQDKDSNALYWYLQTLP